MAKSANTRKPKVVYTCFCCGHEYSTQPRNFDSASSPQYKYNNGFLPYCRACVDNDFKELKQQGLSTDDIIRRLCMKFNLYYSQTIVDGVKNNKGKSDSVFRNYVSRLNLRAYKAIGKSYENTLQEEKEDRLRSVADIKENSDIDISQETIDFFGAGFLPDEYLFLQKEYNDWTSRYECESKAQEEGFKSLAMCQLTLRDVQTGKNTKVKFTEAMKTFQEVMGTLNIKPVQNKTENMLSSEGVTSVIDDWEKHDPLPDIDDSLKDVDGIQKYIRVFFLGHLLKMFGKKNKYEKEYEEEIAKYTVDMPEDAEDDMFVSD